MDNRILLMNPPSGLYRRDDRCQSKVEDQAVRVVFPPVELAVLASVARGAGAQTVWVRDYPAMGAGREEFLADLEKLKPTLILVNTTAHTMEEDLAALRLAREGDAQVRTFARGESVSILADAMMPTHPELDAILDGEPELTFGEIISGKPLSEIRGVVWRDAEGRVRRNEGRPLIEPLDQLPLPAYDLLNLDLYRSPENGRRIAAIYAQRGCPAKCIFCPAGSLFEYRVRERTVENVVDEIEMCVREHGIRDFLFHGDTFTLHKRWLIDLCRLIIERKLEVRWGCNSRVDTLDDERADWMKRAGCWVVAFGFEHGDQAMLDKMKKGARVEKAFEVVEVCRRNGLKVHGFFVVGMPWETQKTLTSVLDFTRRLNPDFFDFNIAYPLPGTEYHDIVVRDGLFESADPTKGGYGQAAVRTYELTSAELTVWRRRALLRMYGRPGYIWRTFSHAASSGNTRHYARAAWQRLGNLLSA